MPYSRPLTLKVANRKDFTILIGILFVLSLVSALLSPQPVLLTIFVLLIFGVGWLTDILYISNINDVKLILVIFPDGRARLEADQELKSEGILSGQQWCTRRVAILQYIAHGKRHHLVLLSTQQSVDEFRRLKVWLRQDFCRDGGAKPVSGI
jgi:hypothetical protein